MDYIPDVSIYCIGDTIRYACVYVRVIAYNAGYVWTRQNQIARRGVYISRANFIDISAF